MFTTKTDTLSAPRSTRLYDPEGAELAHYVTTRTDEKDRAYSVSIDGGVSFTTKRSLRVSSAELAHYVTTRTDEKDRAYSVSIDGGVSFTTKRSLRVSSSTCEAIIKAGQTGWTGLTQRAWSSRFEVHSEDGKVLVRAKQVPALRGDAYDIEVLYEDKVIEMVLLALIARSVIRDDAPIPV